MTTLFRQEVLQKRADKLSGDVSIAVPVSWQTVGYTLATALATAVGFLAAAPYARVETATGTIVPDAGTSLVMPTRAGIVSLVSVHEGQRVAKGAQLIAIRAEEDGPGVTSAAAQMAAALAQQDSSLGLQLAAVNATTFAQRTQVEAQRSGLAAEIAQLETQRGFQQQLVSSTEGDIDRVRSLVDRGFISGRDMRLKEEELLSRQQALSQITQSLAAKRSSLNEAERSSAQLAAQARVQANGIEATRAQVAQEAASARGARSYVIRAPFAGRVAALTARVGQSANAQTALMTIVPEGSELRAQLAIPSTAIGFVKAGQEVHLAIDAFPYQRFGTVNGRVLAVPTSAIPGTRSDGATVAVYPVMATLDRDGVEAFGRSRALLSGMTLTARVVTERQSLLEWLFEPVFAVRKR